MNFHNIFLFLIFYTCIYYKKHVYVPKIYSNNPVIRKLKLHIIYPFYFLPFGFLQTIFQLIRRIEIRNSKKRTIKIKIGDEAILILDEYVVDGVGEGEVRRVDQGEVDQGQVDEGWEVDQGQVDEGTWHMQHIVHTVSASTTHAVHMNSVHSPPPNHPHSPNLNHPHTPIFNHPHTPILNHPHSPNITINHPHSPILNHTLNITHPNHNVLLVHGLNGSGTSSYIKGMANTFLNRNCRVFCFNARGVNSIPKCNIFSHIGLISDIKIIVEYILRNYKGNLSLIGFSLGSNWVAKLLSEFDNSRILMGIAVCCPFDFCFLNSYFDNGILKRPIKYFMLNNYKRYIKKSIKDKEVAINLDKCRNLIEIDTIMLNSIGISDINAFYNSSSCIYTIKNIKKPFLFINTEDDPIIPAAVIPFQECINNSNTGIIILKGGHLGFFTNSAETMAEKICGDFFDLCRADA